MKKKSMIAAIAFIIGLVAGNCLALDTAGIDIHAFVSQGYIKTTEHNFFGDTEDGSFEFSEFGINFVKVLPDKLQVGLQVFARDFGSNGNNEISIDWAFGDYLWKNWLGIRAGKVKTPKGLYNETRDIDMQRTFIFPPQSVYPEILRDTDLGLLGVGIYGNIDLRAGGDLYYQLMYGTQNIDANERVSQALQGTVSIHTPVENDAIDVDKKYVIGLVWDTPLEGFRMGLTHDNTKLVATSHFTDATSFAEKGEVSIVDFDKISNTVFSAEYTFGNLLLAGEYIQTKKKYRFINVMERDITADGWYISASYQFNDWFALGSYYSESYNDKDDRDGENYREGVPDHRAYFKDICFTTRFTVNEYWTLKLEGHRFSGTCGVNPLDQEQDESIFAEEDWYLFAAKATFSF